MVVAMNTSNSMMRVIRESSGSQPPLLWFDVGLGDSEHQRHFIKGVVRVGRVLGCIFSAVTTTVKHMFQHVKYFIIFMLPSISWFYLIEEPQIYKLIFPILGIKGTTWIALFAKELGRENSPRMLIKFAFFNTRND